MSEDKEKLQPADQPPPYGSVADEGGTGSGGEVTEDTAPPHTDSDQCSAVDTRYLRSIDGILKLISIPLAIVGIIVTSVALLFGPSGWYYFVGIGYVIYVVIVIIIETFVPNVFINRVIDAVIVGLYGLLWLISAIVNTTFAATFHNVALGVASIFAYVCAGLCIAQVVFGIWFERKGRINGPAKPLCGN